MFKNQEKYELFLGGKKSYITYPEARCLLEVTPKRKFSGVNVISSYNANKIQHYLRTISDRFGCTGSELIIYAKKMNFNETFYRIERSHRSRNKGVDGRISDGYGVVVYVAD